MLVKFLENADIDSKTLERFQQYLKDTGKATSIFTTLTQKAGSVLKSFGAALGSMAVNWAIGKIIDFAATVIDNWIHNVDNAKEELEEANQRLQETNSKLETTSSRIDELNAKDNLSLVEAEELNKLKETNEELERELRIREEIAKVKGEKANKEALLFFDRNSGTRLDYVHSTQKDRITNPDFWLKSPFLQLFNPTFAFRSFNPFFDDKIREVELYIERAEKLKRKLAGITNPESKEYKSTSDELARTEEKLSKMITEFMEKDDLLIEGEDKGMLTRLYALYEKYDIYTNGKAYAVENKLSSILAKADFANDAKELEELGKSGELSLDNIASKFPNLISYLDDAGISAQELYQYIMALSNPDATNYKNIKKQLLYSIGGRQDEASETLHEILSLDEEELVLNAYLKVRAQYGDHPDGWTAKDWVYNIQQELNNNPVEAEIITPLSISDTVTQLNTQLKPALDSLQSAHQDIFTDDGFSLNSIDILSTCDTIKSKLDEMSDPEGLNLDVDYSAFEDFVRVLNNTESTEYDVEKAFDALATSITQAALSGAEDFETMKAALEDLGVANNEMVAFQALASNTEMLEQALAKANASMDDFIVNMKDGSVEATEAGLAFLEEKVGAENCAEALNILAFHKQLCNLQGMDTAGEVANLKTLAENAGYAGEVIQYLTELEQIYQEVASGTIDPAVIGAKIVRAAQLQTLIRGAASKVDYKPFVESASKAGSAAGEAAGKSYADALKDELSNLNSAISYIGGVIGDQIDLFQEQKDAAVDALEAEKEAAEEALEAEKELVQEKIDAKQAEIDAIEDAAKARKNELDLQKAQYDLERVQNQKTMLAYSESKGMHYVADTKEIRQAKEAATEAKENIQVANMEKDIAGLNDTIEGLDKKIGESNEYYGKLIEETGKYWDSLIKGLEEYKSRWQELADIEEQAKMEAMLRNLGITTEDILSMSGSAFGSFKDTYLGLLSEMYAGNGEMSKMLQEFGGISTGTLGPLPGALDAVAGSLGRLSASAGDAGANTSTVSGNMGALSTSAAGLNDNLPGVASTLNDILEDNKLETAAGQLREVAGAIQSVSDALGGMPTGMDISGVAGQFDALGSSVGRASASISGGDAPKVGPPGGAPGNNATNAQGGAYSLVGSIKGLKSEADKSVGTNENSGIIGQFNRLGASVARVSAAVGGRAAEPGGNAGDGGKGPGSLISSVTALGPAAGETLGEPDGEGVAGRFGQLATTIAGAEGHVAGIISKLDELGKMPPAECTIVVNVETRGGLPGGTPANPVSDAIGALGKAGGQHTTKHKGKAYAQGTALVAGDWEAQSAGGKALVGEAGYEIVVRGGRFFTVGDRGPEMFPIQKGDIVFNHRQSVELLERGHTTGRGKAYADGTVGGGKSLTPDGAILEPYDPATDASSFGIFVRKFNNYLESIDHNVSKLATSAMYENGRQIQEAANQINSSTNINNTRNQPTINVGGISITCPGVTSQEVMKNVGIALDEKFRGFSNYADQQSRIRR